MHDAHAGFDPSYFGAVARAEDEHFWFRARNRVIRDAARRMTKGWPSGYRVLEVGCGTGQAMPALVDGCPGGRVFGLDLYAEGLAFARRRVAVPLVRGDARCPPFREAFQVVAAFDVIEHLDDDVGALRSLGDLVAPRGSLLVTVPADPRLWSYFDEAARHRRRYTAAQLRAALEAAGFGVERLTPYMAATFPLVWLRRKATSGRGGSHATRRRTETELKVVPVLNGLILGLLLAEARLIASGHVLPFGTSLIASARRRV